LAAEAFAHTAAYDRAIANWFASQLDEASASARSGPDGLAEKFPESLVLRLSRRQLLRYGENPHQQAAVYAWSESGEDRLIGARQLAGKELSYNNLLDLDAALEIARGLPGAAAVVSKHNNPCGAASADRLAVAMRRALDGDPTSAFGCVIGVNQTVDAETADVLTEPERFVEAIVAPDFDAEAVRVLTTRPKWKSSVRLLAVGASKDTPNVAANDKTNGASDNTVDARPGAFANWAQIRSIDGGLLVQDADRHSDPESLWKTVTDRAASAAELADLEFAWAVVRGVKSNAIVLASDRTVRGVGAGQMSRVDSVQIAIRKAGAHARGCVLASDAFFPFADSIDEAAAAGVRAVIQPGGSRRDDEVVAACNRHGLAMIFTDRRHFRH
jgi:phosphoribosylaminoimidazolecarboxamide formyltransferase/IMP cyclohydrolase